MFKGCYKINRNRNANNCLSIPGICAPPIWRVLLFLNSFLSLIESYLVVIFVNKRGERPILWKRVVSERCDSCLKEKDFLNMN